MPTDIKDAMRLCEFLMSVNGTLREAVRRIVSYFMTDIEIAPFDSQKTDQQISSEEKRKYIDFLREGVEIDTELHAVATDYMTYGNVFASILLPFKRQVVCSRTDCSRYVPFAEVFKNPIYKTEWRDFAVHITCPRCGTRGKAIIQDYRIKDPEKIVIRRWEPLNMDIAINPWTGEPHSYFYKLDPDLKQAVTRGDWKTVENLPWELVDCVAQNRDLEFADGMVFHMRDKPLAGVKARGWGIPRLLASLKYAWYCQLLHRQNEAIAADFIVPWRVISMGTRGGATPESSDPMLSFSAADFVQHGKRMVRDHRQDPTSVHFFPFPMNYQLLGGEGQSLAPEALIQQGFKSLLDSIGCPVELYAGSLTTQTAPAALRLFEANWRHMTLQLNTFLRFVVDALATTMAWEPVVCRLSRVTYADDLNRQMAQLQLMQAGLISKTTGLATVGVDKAVEDRNMLDEQLEELQTQELAQKRLEQNAVMEQAIQQQQQPEQPGQPLSLPGQADNAAAPMDPAAGGGGGGADTAAQFAASQPMLPYQPTTLEDIQATAQTLAQQAMQMPRSQRTSFMLKLKEEQPEVHAIVRAQIQSIEQQAELQGRDMVLQQQFGVV